MLYFIRQVVKSRMAVNLVVGRFVKTFCFIRISCMDVFTLHCPNAHTFLSPGINVPCIFNSHLWVGCVKRTYMFMIQSLFTADEYFPERPFTSWCRILCSTA